MQLQPQSPGRRQPLQRCPGRIATGVWSASYACLVLQVPLVSTRPPEGAAAHIKQDNCSGVSPFRACLLSLIACSPMPPFAT